MWLSEALVVSNDDETAIRALRSAMLTSCPAVECSVNPGEIWLDHTAKHVSVSEQTRVVAVEAFGSILPSDDMGSLSIGKQSGTDTCVEIIILPLQTAGALLGEVDTRLREHWHAYAIGSGFSQRVHPC